MKRFMSQALGLVAASLMVPAVLAQQPAVRLQSVGQLVSPDSAWTYYGAPASPPVSTAARSPEIKALARALSRGGAITGDAFAGRVVNYVRRNIEVEWRFGLGKGARGAVIDQSGTPFDQAQLMVEILREGQAGLNPTYRIGSITLTPDQFGKWTGFVTGLNQSAQTFTVDAAAACRFLADGGIPALVNGATDCGSLSGSVTSVQIAHIWVMVNGKAYDPSYKPRLLRTGIDIAAGMQCGTDAAPTCGSAAQTQAMTNALTGTQFTAPYIERVNRTALETRLQTYAVNLENAIIANRGRDAPLEDVIGGTIPDDSYSPTAAATLTYQTGSQPAWGTTWTGEIPDIFRTRFLFELHNINDGGVWFFADQLAGKRMYVTTHSGQPPTPNFVRTTKIWMEDVEVASIDITISPNYTDSPQFRVDFPYASNATAGSTPNGTYGDIQVFIQGATDARDANMCVPNGGGHQLCNLGYGNIYSLLFNLGNSGPGQEQHYERLLGDGHGWRFPSVTFPVFGFAPHPFAAPLFVQGTAAARIIGAGAKSAITQQYSMGVIFQNYRPGDGQPYFNVVSAVSIASTANNATNRAAAFSTYAATISALEGSIRQQAQDGFEAPTSVSVFKLFNDRQYRFFETSSAAMLTQVLNNSQNYTTSGRAFLQSFGNAGFSVILPRNASIGDYTLPGGGFITYNITPELAHKADAIAPLISERFKGGGAISSTVQPMMGAVDTVQSNTYSVKKREFWAWDLASGTLNLTPPPDLTLGPPGVPGSLQFRRSYSSAAQGRQNCVTNYFDRTFCQPWKVGGNSQIGGGWDHNYNRRATWGTNALESFGVTAGVRAADTIARLNALLDINRTSTFAGRMTGIFTTYSLINSFLKNSVLVEMPPKSYAFVRLPSGAFLPPSTEKQTSVSVTGTIGPYLVIDGAVTRNYSNTSISFTDDEGAVTSFSHGSVSCGSTGGSYSCVGEPKYVASQTILPNGVRETFTYDTSVQPNAPQQAYELLSVSTSTGNTFTFNSSPAIKLSTVTDGVGRSISLGCTIEQVIFSIAEGSSVFPPECVGGATVTNPIGGVSKTDYGPASGSPQWTSSIYNSRVVGTVYTPLLPSTPYLKLDYDPMLRLSKVTDIEGKVTTLFVASVSDERWRLGEVQDPSGAVTSTEFNRYGRPTRVTDARNYATSHRYDNAGQLVRTLYPEGNAIERQYDARGNETRVCTIPKTRAGASCDAAAGDLVVSTTYMEGPTLLATQCVNRKTCNRPAYIDDARNHRTDFGWHGASGGLESVTRPADDLGVRPQETYSYTSLLGTDGAGFAVVSSKTERIDAATSVVTSFGYEGAANRFALRESVVDNGGLTLRTCYKFDATGNLISQTKPKALLGACP